ncbi:MAG: metallophosphoesterase [Clostridia bacterium]|nr:metallophosphoesterase [Clostridia bacterium]
MALFVLADTHLSITTHKPMDIFGSRWKDHTDRIRQEWEAVVSPDDTVVIPGDISWGMNFEEAREDFLFLDSLPGHKLISKGNHDYWWATKSKQDAFFEKEGITTISQLYNNAYKVDEYMVCGSRGWYNDDHNAPKDSDYQKIVNREVGRMELSIKAANDIDPKLEKLMFLHFPPVFGDYVCEEIVDCLVSNGIRRCYYGHIHGKYSCPPVTSYRGIDFYIISADYLDFKPMLID